MDAYFDLTTDQGRVAALSFIQKHLPSAGAVVGCVAPPVVTIFNLSEKLIDCVRGVFDSSVLCEKQAKTAEDIIIAGSKAGAKKIKVTIDQDAGIDFKFPVNMVNIEAKAGSSGKITLEVEYL